MTTSHRLLLSSALALALGALLPTAAAARPMAAAGSQQSPAAQMVMTNSSQILATLQQRRAEFKASPAALRQYINVQMANFFDRDYAARLVLGIHARGASQADIRSFADALVGNLTQRYGSALLGFEGKPSFRFKSQTTLPNNLGVKVSTDLIRPGNDPTPVDYLLHNVGGKWKVFDVMIEGVSYVQTFRNQFDTPLRQKSIAQVAADLRNGSLQVGDVNGKGKPARGQ